MPKYVPKPETLALLRTPGNPINGLGEAKERRPSPFFWHPPDKHPYGDLQVEARRNSRKCPGAAEAFKAAYQHPALVPVAPEPRADTPENFAATIYDSLGIPATAMWHDAQTRPHPVYHGEPIPGLT